MPKTDRGGLIAEDCGELIARHYGRRESTHQLHSYRNAIDGRMRTARTEGINEATKATAI
jgi:hypothetical protein